MKNHNFFLFRVAEATVSTDMILNFVIGFVDHNIQKRPYQVSIFAILALLMKKPRKRIWYSHWFLNHVAADNTAPFLLEF